MSQNDGTVMVSTYGVTVPEEPPVRTVVIDAGGWAWQRAGEVWVSCKPLTTGEALGAAVVGVRGLSAHGLDWSELLVKHGPVTRVTQQVCSEDDN